MASSSRIYLDNAATSFPKPEAVYAAVDHYQRQNGAAIGRGTSRESVEVQRIADRCRQLASLTLGAEGPDRIVFTFNGTDGLNLALFGLCRPGDQVITTEFEHNSVLRPLRWLKDHLGVEVTMIRPGPSGQIDPGEIQKQIRTTTRLIAVQHASNVTGVVQPIDAICELAREAGILTLVDAAQTAGHWPINLASIPADLLVCPGHKGLLGPLGTGLVYIRPGVEQVLECYRLGGTGTQSEDDRQPDQMPDRYEAGNHNAPGLVGLCEGMTFVKDQTVEAIHQSESELTERLVEGLKSCPGITVYGHQPAIPRVGVVAFNVDGFAPHEVASILDETFGIQSRAGLHCAPGVHRFLGTFDRGGTVRFSVGVFTTTDDVDQAIAGVRKLASCSP